MGHRPKPRVDRARHQIERAAYVPTCSWCQHAVTAHDMQGGQRVCTRGHDEPSCRECREIRDGLSPMTLAMWNFTRIMASPPSARPAPLVFGKPFRPHVDTAVSTRS